MDAPEGFNPYMSLSQNELDNQLLSIASDQNALAKVILIVEAGANINVMNSAQWNPLMYAALNPNKEIVNYLIKKGANLEGINVKNTPIVYAVQNDHLQVLNLLIEQGVEISKNGIFSPLARAIDSGNENIAYRLLCEYSTEQIEQTAKTNQKFGKVIDKFNHELKKNKTKLYQLVMPFLLKMDFVHGGNTLLLDLLKLISNLVLKLQDDEGFPEWYQHRIKRDAIEACYFICPIQKDENINSFIEVETPLPRVTLFHESKKRKAEDELEENGRNKRLCVENQDEQDMNLESKHFSFGGDCSVQ